MLDTLAKTFFTELKNAIPSKVSDLPEREFRAVLEGIIQKLNLVSREEFDAQQLVLQRTREKLELMEKQMSELEALRQK